MENSNLWVIIVTVIIIIVIVIIIAIIGITIKASDLVCAHQGGFLSPSYSSFAVLK